MKLEKTQIVFFFWKGHKDSKKIEKNKVICSSFDILGSIRTF